MMITLGMVLFSYGLLGPVWNDVGILVLLPSCGSEFCCLIMYWNGGGEGQYFPSARFGFAIF